MLINSMETLFLSFNHNRTIIPPYVNLITLLSHSNQFFFYTSGNKVKVFWVSLVIKVLKKIRLFKGKY